MTTCPDPCPRPTMGVLVTIDPSVSHSGETEHKVKPIDGCIAPLVAAMEAGGVRMLGSCCGHGEGPGEILLADGRVLTITDRPHDTVGDCWCNPERITVAAAGGDR